MSERGKYGIWKEYFLLPETEEYDTRAVGWCPVCGLEDDEALEEDLEIELGANFMSLNEYRIKYKKGLRLDWLIESIDNQL